MGSIKMVRFRVVVAVFFSLSLASKAAFAEEVQQAAIELEPIVITPSRPQSSLWQVTHNTTVLERQDIDALGVETIPDLLRTEAGVSIRDYTGTGKTVNADIRGFGEAGSQNMLVLINGRRVNAIDISGTDWSQIPLSMVERVEIVRGTSSVLYGDNAVGGVVNIITKDGRSFPRVSLGQKGGSFNTAATEAEIGGKKGGFSYYLNGTYFKTDGYRDNSDLLRKDFGGRIDGRLNPSLTWGLNFGYHKDRTGLPGALFEDEIDRLGRRASTKPSDTSRTEDGFGELQTSWVVTDSSHLDTNASVRVRSVDGDYVSSSWKNENYITTVCVSPKYVLDSKLWGRDNTVILGADFSSARQAVMDGAKTGPNDKIILTKSDLGFYLHDKYKLFEKLGVEAGLRRERCHYLFDQVSQVQLFEKSKLSNEAYDLGVSYAYQEGSRVYGNFSTGFRYPLVDEFFTSNTWGFGGLNASLSAQTTKSYEVGVQHRFKPGLQAKVDYFLMQVENELYYDPYTYRNANYDKTLHEGVEFEMQWRPWDGLSTYANYTWTRARFRDGTFAGNRIPAVPDNQFSIGINCKVGKEVTLVLVSHYVGQAYLISDQKNIFSRNSDYLTLDARIDYHHPKGFEVFLALNNLFDAEYAEYGVIGSFGTKRAFYPAAGRNVMAGVRYSF